MSASSTQRSVTRAPAATAGSPAELHVYAHPEWVLARFVSRRTARSAGLWGLVIGLYTWASTVGFLDVAPTAAGRREFMSSLVSNTGLKALLGDTNGIETVGGFVTWRVTGVMSLVGAIWGLLVSTGSLRGEETAGRWELFLAGRTTSARATAGAVLGLGAGVLLMFLLSVLATIAVGRRHGVGFGAADSVLFAIGIVAAAAEFVAVGALASQLMPIRARAAALATAVFGVSFLVRAVADVAPAAHWLVYLSPLGWVEQLHALSDPAPQWLLPIGAFIAVLVLLTIRLAAHRDLGESTLADSDSADPDLRLLGSQGLLALRLTRTSTVSWILVAGASSMLYGTFAQSAGDAFASSGGAKTFLSDLTHQARQIAGARTYAAIVFLMMMLLLMGYVASAMGAVREEEAEGHLDNLLARQVRRGPWLALRVAIIVAATVAAGLASGLGFWLGAGRNTDLTLHELVLAGINATAPAVLLLGLTVLAFGFVPRSVTLVGYGVLAWSFLVDMLAAAMHLNHWLVDTSLLQHPALAPTTSPSWRVVGTYALLAVALSLLGGARFLRRDLQGS